MAKLFTRKREEIIIDDEYLYLLNNFSWYLDRKGYAKTSVRCFEKGRRQKNVFLHHFILPKKEGLCVDHINQNPLDNRKENLRYATYAQNRFNTSKTKGVAFLKGKWRAYIYPKNKCVSLGGFKTREEAVEARKNAVKMFM